MRKLITLFFVLFSMMSSITAQEETLDLKNQDRVLKSKHNNLELGLMAGAMVYTGDAHCEKFLLKNGLSPAGGAFLRYYLTDRWSLRGNFLGGKIKGDDKNYPGKEHGDRNFKFTSNILDFNGTLNFEPWGHKRYSSGTFRKIFSPYLNIGAGFVYSNPKTDYNEANNRNLAPQIAADKADIKKMNFSVPFGIGWRYDFSEKLTIGAEASYRVPFTDYLDGISKSGNPKAKDWYETGTVNIAYRLKYKRDMDKDGIADEDDACPTERGTLRGKGCPDQDGDGVVDKMDSCPTEQGSPALNGCPDKDSDGIADRDDACPDYPGDAVNSGCPDKDGDGIIDMKDDCPTVKGLVAFGGCPEIKKEIISSVSTTSTTSSTITSNVLVSPDAVVVGTFTDYSSVENLSVGSTYKGNGVEVDPRQLITNTVNVSSETTTTISSEETSIFEEALYGIQFETGSAVITNASFNILNKVYNVMRNRSAVNYEIGGHTDNQGNSIANQRLSEARAKAVYNFLVKKGISASRLTFVGYGDTNPVADNGTSAGRAKNRRVQFSIR